MKIIKSHGYKKLAEQYPLDDPEGSPAEKFWRWPGCCGRGEKKDIADKGKNVREILNRKRIHNPEKDDWDDMMLSRRPPMF